jgi:hypothetical protein
VSSSTTEQQNLSRIVPLCTQQFGFLEKPMGRGRKSHYKVAPDQSNRVQTISVNACLQLKENTRNRLKLSHPVESREKNLTEICQLLEITYNPPKVRTKPSPIKTEYVPSERLYCDVRVLSDGNRPHITVESKSPKVGVDQIKKFVQRQFDWLSSKDCEEEYIDIDVSKFKQVSLSFLRIFLSL